MAGKVIHISDEHHRKAKEYCTKYEIRMSEWIGELIDKELRKENGEFKKKILPEIVVSDKEDDPFSAPPFWETRKQ